MDALFNLNIKSVIYGIKYAMAAMKSKGTKGSILVNSSVMSHIAKSNMHGGGVYAATKAAADMLVQYAAAEGAADDSGTLTLRSHHFLLKGRRDPKLCIYVLSGIFGWCCWLG